MAVVQIPGGQMSCASQRCSLSAFGALLQSTLQRHAWMLGRGSEASPCLACEAPSSIPQRCHGKSKVTSAGHLCFGNLKFHLRLSE